MLYELIGIVRPGNLVEVKELVRSTGQQILKQGGVIRSINNWGVFTLPRAISKSQALHHNGHYFVMRYDASTKTQEEVCRALRVDPRMIRTTSVKLGDGKLDTMSRFGQINWLTSS